MSEITDAQVDGWRAAIGRIETRTQRLEVESLRRFALAIDADPDVERVQPVLAHWAFFLDMAADADLEADGHPRRGAFIPAMPLPRRMFAGGTIRFLAPLELGAEAQMHLRIAELAHKRGRSGELVFVEVEQTLSQGGDVRVEERRSFVYRPLDPTPTPLPEVAADAEAGEVWRPTPVNLFRFSAVTFNAHRIHYDQPYVTGVEGYPALVVHGPFTAVRLAAFAARQGPLERFAFRASAPLFVGQPIRLRTAGQDEVQAVRCDGAIATTAKVGYR